MNREEAIRWILQVQQSEPWQERVIEALDMAIEALKAEPKRIPVTEILNYLDVELHPIISPEHWCVYSELHDMISNLPSADRQRGEWIDIGGVVRWGCSLCHYAYDQKFNFCPNCGSDNRERSEE